MEFHKTIMGKKYYENDLPLLIKSLNKLSEAIEAQNLLTEKMLTENKKSRAMKTKQLNESKLDL
jgi:hypothetical protein